MHRAWTDVRRRALRFLPGRIGGLGRAKTVGGSVRHCVHVGERLLLPRRRDAFEEMIVLAGRTVAETGETFAFVAAQFTLEVVEFSSVSLVRGRLRWKSAVQAQQTVLVGHRSDETVVGSRRLPATLLPSDRRRLQSER